MASIYSSYDSNIRKTWFLMAIFLIVVIAVGWFIGWYMQNPAILYFAVIFSVVMNIGSYWYSDKIVLKMSGAEIIKREENRELWNIVENLSITAGIPMPKVYIIKDPAPNAFATGRNKEHSAVAVTSGLLSILDKNEVEGVIAHELSHIKNMDILIATVVVVLVGFIAILSDFFLRWSLLGGRREDRGGAGGMLAIIGIVLIILSPLISTIIKLAISRKREFLADASGVLLTRYPEGLASALKKISGYSGQRLKRASKATAHLYISDPFVKKIGGRVFKLFMTHPPVEERINKLTGV